MSLLIASVAGELDGSGPHSLTDSATFNGETPKAALIIYTFAGSGTTSDINAGFGFIDSAGNQKSVWSGDNDNVSSSNNASSVDTSYAVHTRDVATSHVVNGQWSGALVADGVQFTKITGALHIQVQVILFGGDDLLNAAATSVAFGISTSPVTGLGFKPNCMFGLFSAAGWDESFGERGGLSLGVACLHEGTTLRQHSSYHSTENNRTTQVGAVGTSNDKAVCCENSAGTITTALEITSFDDDGFSYDSTGSGGLFSQIYFLALEFRNPGVLHLHNDVIDFDTLGTSDWTSETLTKSDNGVTLLSTVAGPTTFNSKDTSVGLCVSYSHIFHNTEDRCRSISYTADLGAGTMNNGSRWTAQTTDGTSDNWSMARWSGTFVAKFQSDEPNKTVTLENCDTPAASMVKVPAWYLMISNEEFPAYLGNDRMPGYSQGDDPILRIYQGDTQLY